MTTYPSTRRGIIVLALLSLLGPGCDGRPREACEPVPPLGTLGTICGFTNPEDIEAVPAAGLLVVSQMRGRDGAGGALVALVPPVTTPHPLWPTGDGARDVGTGPVSGDPACTTPPAADVFAPHGIASVQTTVRGLVHVAVVGHGGREAVELFDLVGTGNSARLTWRGCVPLPPDEAGNDVALTLAGEIVVANFQPTMSGLRGAYYMVQSGLGWPTGDVIVWRAGEGWHHVPGTAAAGANGVAVSPDGKTLFYAETGAGRVARVPLAGGGSPAFAMTGGTPDSLAWASRKTLLAAVHTDRTGLLACLVRRPCRSAWAVVEIDPESLRTSELLHDDGQLIGAVTSMAELDGRFYFGAAFGDRIGVWRPAE
ncbi:MAG TPA: hypothetical protein VGR62_25710 [Candidatus Binatia bacterium]|jgi:hypothetical protein|nr:hypothetical protein [Candidatus Binatia bacterium]